MQNKLNFSKNVTNLTNAGNQKSGGYDYEIDIPQNFRKNNIGDSVGSN